MDLDQFIDGAWYVKDGSGLTRSHFFQRRASDSDHAKASCGPLWPIAKLQPSDDANATKVHKVYPRTRCASCWAVECAKARRT